jgi:hypothetical protein
MKTMKTIVIKESAKPHVSAKNYAKVVNEVSKTSNTSGIIGKISYLIKSNSIILF